jgi:2-succinyl-6-hydroxy-2,4-cyclohexadiene-1-carboxylate synthase
MITAIHGFLGLPSDWDFLREAGLEVDARCNGDIPERGDILLGYSMGGRLALNALLNGARYGRAVIVSAGLGVEGEAERAARRAADEEWAVRFERDEWTSLLRDWNAQPVFGGHFHARREEDIVRSDLARALREWSPGTLPPVAQRLHEIEIPVLWIAGDRDHKYVAEAQRGVSLLPQGELWICPDAGHRVPWEQPELFVRRLLTL